MGDGPAYDHMYAEQDRHWNEKIAAQRKRTEALRLLIREHGDGSADGNLMVLELEAANHLRLAYEMFTVLGCRRPPR